MKRSLRWILAISILAGVAILFSANSRSHATSIPRLQCPVGTTCRVGGFNFGDDWTFNKCPAKGPWKKHTGADLRAASGTTVVAAEAGTVKLVYSAGAGWASAILIEHTNGGSKYVTQYMHVDPKPGISPGVGVKRGQPIATVAAISTPHLHFGVWMAPYGPSEGQRGALPACALPTATCNDGSHNDRCFPQSWVNPMSFF
jgi:murein DD-endopeptidase MepM/ murein hydrolase activator NlpD